MAAAVLTGGLRDFEGRAARRLRTAPVFEAYQDFATHGASDTEVFTIAGQSFLAVANYGNGDTVNVNSYVFQWNGSKFELYQELATHGACDLEFFTIADQSFLAVANQNNGLTNNINSYLFRWNGNKFELYQDLATDGAYDMEFFTIAGQSYLAAAYAVNSYLLRWNGNKFESYKEFATHGARDMELFNVSGQTFLAVANFHGRTFNVPSYLYRWSGSTFELHQEFATHGAYDVEVFTIAGQTFLAVANFYNGDNNDDTSGDTYNVNSYLFRWSGSKFGLYQEFATHGACDMEFFTIAGQSFLAVANHGDGDTVNVNSYLFRWNGNKFELYQEFATHGARGMELFTTAGQSFLVVANDGNVNNDDGWPTAINENDVNDGNVSYLLRWSATTNETINETPTKRQAANASNPQTTALIVIGLCLGLAVGATGLAMVCRGQMQGKATDPAWAAISLEQLNAVRKEAKALLGARYAEATLYDINQSLIRPACEAAQKCYAHIVNPDVFLHVDIFVSHAWAENFDEFVNSLNKAFHLHPVKPNLWICAFALIQSSDPKVVSKQVGLDQDPSKSPFTRALRKAEKLLVVRNNAVDLYSRIWCCWELAVAVEHDFLKRPGALIVAGPATFSREQKVDITHAGASNEEDKVRILRHLLMKGSYADINEKLTQVQHHAAENASDDVAV